MSWVGRLNQGTSLAQIGNGVVYTPEDARRMFETGVDGVMIGRGAIDNPWLFGQIKHYLATGEKAEEPGIRERFEVCLRHLKAAVEYRGMKGMYAFRKHYSGYLKGVPNVSHLRSELVRLEEIDRIEERMRAFLEDLESREADVKE